MKKICMIAFAVTIAVSLAGCSLFNGNELTEITLPASMMNNSEMTLLSDLDKYAEENEFESAVWNDDGSLTITLTNKRKASLRKQMEEGLLNSFDNIVNSPDTNYIKSIKASQDYRTVTISADRDEYENSFELTTYIVGMSVVIFQSYAGEEAYVNVVVVDAETGAQIEFSHYPGKE